MNSFDDYTWENDRHDPMTIVVKHQGHVLMRFWIGDAMLGAGRERIMAQVHEWDHLPSHAEWHAAAKEDLVKIKEKYEK